MKTKAEAEGSRTLQPKYIHPMKIEPLEHTILVLSQMDADFTRIAAALGQDAHAGLILDCIEHRTQMLNKLRQIKQAIAHEQLITHEELIANAQNPEPIGDPEIAPELRPQPKATHACEPLARYRRHVRRCEAIAWIVVAVVTLAVVAIVARMKGAL